ncbi:MAG: FdhF/YdeP family oxidoreductase [Flavobacteriales bacterium]|nr:FdhF/YdeP family oxidoreductase [Flavobacteriales bacterium]
MTRKLQLLAPSKHTGIKLGKLKTSAAGFPAVSSSIAHLSKELGLFQGLKIMAKVNQKGGIDCPGCAWPDPAHRSKLGEYCENGAKAIAEEATTARVSPDFFSKHSVEELSTWSDYELGKAGRITHPMMLRKGASHYESISWDDAFEHISQKIKKHAPNESVFYTSGRTGNETAFLYQLMVRKLGTNNLPDCSNMCHESSGVGLGETLGVGKGSVTLRDLYEAEVIMVMGQNPGTNHPRMLSALQKCKQNGGKIIHVNPLPEAGTTKFIDPQSPLEILKGGTKIADLFLQVKINGDLGLLKLIMKGLLEREDAGEDVGIDHDFIQKNTENVAAFFADIRETDEAKCYEQSGLSMEEVDACIELIAKHQKIIICWAMGITQHRNGVANVQEIVNLLLMKGAIAKPGAGTCPVRGHSNVQGDRTMGIYEKPSKSFLESLKKHFKFNPPQEHGYDVVDSISAMNEGKVKVFMAMGGNFISATPDSELTAKAMQKVELSVQISTKLNRSHIITGDEAIILPCKSRVELDEQGGVVQFQSVENSMGVVHRSKGSFAPASEALKSEVRIVCELSSALFPEEKEQWMNWARDYNLVRDEIEATIPGFTDFNRRVRISGGFDLPNVAREGLFIEGKAKFTVNALPDYHLSEGQLIMMTIRSHDQYNTTIYGLDDRYRGIYNERRVILMHRDDMKERGLQTKDIVSIYSDFLGERRSVHEFIVVDFDIAKGCCATYFPEANALVPLKSVAKKSNTPASKFIEVVVEKA